GTMHSLETTPLRSWLRSEPRALASDLARAPNLTVTALVASGRITALRKLDSLQEACRSEAIHLAITFHIHASPSIHTGHAKHDPPLAQAATPLALGAGAFPQA